MRDHAPINFQTSGCTISIFLVIICSDVALIRAVLGEKREVLAIVDVRTSK